MVEEGKGGGCHGKRLADLLGSCTWATPFFETEGKNQQRRSTQKKRAKICQENLQNRQKEGNTPETTAHLANSEQIKNNSRNP